MASKESSRKQFLHAILQEDLAESDKDLLSELIDRDMPSTKREIGFVSPKHTTEFLKMFDNAEQFKFLTHKYNTPSEDSEDHEPHDNLSMASLALQLFADSTRRDKNGASVPTKLYKCFEGFLEGPHWYDSNNIKHTFHWTSDVFKEWAASNPSVHPSETSSPFSKDIEAFKHTIRLRGKLEQIVDDILKEKHISSSDVTKERLSNADFYSFVPVLRESLSRILSGMKDKADELGNTNIIIRYKSLPDPITKKRLAIIEIIQEGSISSKSIEECQERLIGGLSGGDFGEIKKCLKGYANWTVESSWAGEPRRWRILDDTKSEEIEIIKEEDIQGFKHIISFYR